MPAHKRQFVAADEEDDDPVERNHIDNHEQHLKRDDGYYDGNDRGDAADDETEGSSSSSEDEQKDEEEYIMVNLSEIRKEVQCPICLGIIRKTRTVMECLHRFCRECIDKSMRLGNNECPACRTHCASRRSLRHDPNYDALIEVLYPDIDEYEEEELSFDEEEKARNEQIKATIAETRKRQSEASSRKRSSKGETAAFMRNSRLNLRGKRNRRSELQACDAPDGLSEEKRRDSSSADEGCAEVRSKRSRRSGGAQSSQPSDSVDRASDENGSDGVIRGSLWAVNRLVGPSERLWGKGGIRSHTRHGNGNGGANGKNPRNCRMSRLVDYLQSLKEKDDEMDMHLMLVSSNEQTIPNLQQPYLSCKPTLSVRNLCQYVAVQTGSRADDIELYLVKDLQSKSNMSISMDTSKDKLQALNEEQSLGELKIHNFNHGYVLLAYQRKLQTG